MFFITDDVLSNADHDVRVGFAVDVRRMQVDRLQHHMLAALLSHQTL